MAKLQDVATLAGVSTATVSRTLNNPELVDPSTRQKVANAISTSGYQRNETARSLAMRSSRTIGLLTDTFSSNYFAPILDEAIKILHDFGYYAIVEATGNHANHKNVELQKRAWRSLINRQVESIIVLCAFMDDRELDEMLMEFPSAINIGHSVEQAKSRCITVDHYTGGQLAAQHLIEMGHRNIAMISGPADRLDSQQRGDGFKDELNKHGIDLPSSKVYTGNYSVLGGSQAMQKLLETGHEVTAVFAQNDDMAVGVINECFSRSIEIPKDLSIIGFDDSSMATSTMPPLTTISQPLKQMSQSAATLALNLSVGRKNDKPLAKPTIHFLPELIARQSVANLAKPV